MPAPPGRSSARATIPRPTNGRSSTSAALHIVYACDCSRKDIGGERYAGRCRTRGLGERPDRGLRVAIAPGVERFDDLLLGPQEQTPASQCGDLLLRDRDGNWTYQFAVTVDDCRQDVNLVIRGADLLSSTGRQFRLGAHARARRDCRSSSTTRSSRNGRARS